MLPVVGKDGVTRMTRSCTEGPVFFGDQVRWDAAGTVPADCLLERRWLRAGDITMSNVVDMRAQLASAALPSPVLTASGCAAAGRELDRFFDVTAIGAVVTKSIATAPRSGRATPRMAETPAGMLNSIGLQGPGVEEFIRKDLRWLRERGARTVVFYRRGSVSRFAELANRLRHGEGNSRDRSQHLVSKRRKPRPSLCL